MKHTAGACPRNCLAFHTLNSSIKTMRHSSISFFKKGRKVPSTSPDERHCDQAPGSMVPAGHPPSSVVTINSNQVISDSSLQNL